jgi:hypothetical protein
MKFSKSEPYPHYWICGSCAKKQGWKWPKGHCATMHSNTCPGCGKLETLSCAINDWLKPGQKKIDPLLWD